ncbi:MAG: hypothetical protein ACRDRN_12655, partial [Sciscionella sp.]
MPDSTDDVETRLVTLEHEVAARLREQVAPTSSDVAGVLAADAHHEVSEARAHTGMLLRSHGCSTADHQRRSHVTTSQNPPPPGRCAEPARSTTAPKDDDATYRHDPAGERHPGPARLA